MTWMLWYISKLGYSCSSKYAPCCWVRCLSVWSDPWSPALKRGYTRIPMRAPDHLLFIYLTRNSRTMVAISSCIVADGSKWSLGIGCERVYYRGCRWTPSRPVPWPRWGCTDKPNHLSANGETHFRGPFQSTCWSIFYKMCLERRDSRSLGVRIVGFPEACRKQAKHFKWSPVLLHVQVQFLLEQF